MQKVLGRIPALMITAVFAVLGFFLRNEQLKNGFEESGLPNGNGVVMLAIVCVLALGIFLAVAMTKKKRSGFAENFSSSFPAMLLAVFAAGLLLAGSGLVFLQQNETQATDFVATKLTAGLGIVTALCYIAAAVGQFRAQAASPVVYLVPVVYYILQLIFNFKSWSTDPIILDYCFKLFAMIATMLAVFHLGGFAFDAGKRRTTIFLCLAGVFFSTVALADGLASRDMIAILQTAGSALWLLAGAWQLLRKK